MGIDCRAADVAHRCWPIHFSAVFERCLNKTGRTIIKL
jgi:hypothetical protein